MCEVTGFFDYVMFLEAPRKSVVFLDQKSCFMLSEAHYINMPFWEKYAYSTDPRYKWLYTVKPGFEAYYLRNKGKSEQAPVSGEKPTVAIPANLEESDPLIIDPSLLSRVDQAPGGIPGWAKNALAIGGLVAIVILIYNFITKRKSNAL